MTRAELYELQLYYELEPFGERRDDLRMGQLLAMLYNAFLKRRQDPRAVPEDFVMFDPETSEKRAEARGDIQAKLTTAMGRYARTMAEAQARASGQGSAARSPDPADSEEAA